MRKALNPAEIGFTHRDHQRLQKAPREETELRTFRRVQAVLLMAEGCALAMIAHLTGFSLRSL
jgi:hypothetical protein